MRNKISMRVWRDHDTRNAKSEPAVRVARGSRRSWNRCQRRWHVIVKSPPFIEVDDQDCFRPIRTSADCIVDLIEKNLAVPDVGVRVIVLRCAAGFIFKTRIDKGNIRQGAGGRIGQELRERLGNIRVIGSPKREKWQIAKIVATGESFVRQSVPNRW